jgi:hypothetical protein
MPKTTQKTQPAAPTAAPREYETVSINFEKEVLAAAKNRQRTQARQFRSVSAFVNFHLAVALGLETP